jgi:ABC-type lipoprotein release transport system permease subunit
VWLVLTVLIAVAGGAAIAAAAGARRTASAYPRFVIAERGFDLMTGGDLGDDPGAAVRTLEHLPEVAEYGQANLVSFAAIFPSGRLATAPEIIVVSDPTDRVGVTINRFKILSGRALDPSASDEAVVDFATADRYGLRVGSVIRVVIGDPTAKPPQTVAVRVVGIEAAPGFFPAFGSAAVFPLIFVSPSFGREHHIPVDPANAAPILRLKHGQTGVARYVAEVRRAGLRTVDIPAIQSVLTTGVQQSIRLEVISMWALAVLLALAGMAILGQALARQTYLASDGLPDLRAMGMTPAQLTSLGLARAAAVGLCAAVLAIPVAILLSPLTPIGLARIAEPHPGIAVDGSVIATGTVLLLAFVILVAAVPSWRAARSATRAAKPALGARSPVTSMAERAGSPTRATGIRMALQPGRGRTAVPVRSAILAATLAVATLASSVVLWTSLHHLLATPRLSGYPWDVFVDASGENGDARLAATASAAIRRDPDVANVTQGGFVNVVIGGHHVFGVIPDEHNEGLLAPVMLEGRAPRGADEVALGTGSLREAHVRVGDRVTMTLDQSESTPPTIHPRVVGVAVIPPAPFAATGPAEGAILPGAAFVRLNPEAAPALRSGTLPFLVKFNDGVDPEDGLRRLQERLPAGVNFYPTSRGDQATLGRIAQVPLALAVVLAAIALGTLGQTLVTSVRARRRDLAILKTLGFSRGQVRSAVAWQASTMGAVALVIGLPIGIAAGRWVWRFLAEGLGVLPQSVVNPIAVAVAIPATLLLVNLIAAIPARSAARTKPADVLRSE